MKFQTVCASGLVAGLLVVASGAAMAVNDCSEFYLSGVIEEDIIVEGGDACGIEDATVTGDIIATNTADVTINDVQVSGNIRIKGARTASVNLTRAQSIRLRGNAVAWVFGSLANRNIVVNGNEIAVVKRNGAVRSIICRNNTELFEFRNNTEGTEDCSD